MYLSELNLKQLKNDKNTEINNINNRLSTNTKLDFINFLNSSLNKQISISTFDNEVNNLKINENDNMFLNITTISKNNEELFNINSKLNQLSKNDDEITNFNNKLIENATNNKDDKNDISETKESNNLNEKKCINNKQIEELIEKYIKTIFLTNNQTKINVKINNDNIEIYIKNLEKKLSNTEINAFILKLEKTLKKYLPQFKISNLNITNIDITSHFNNVNFSISFTNNKNSIELVNTSEVFKYNFINETKLTTETKTKNFNFNNSNDNQATYTETKFNELRNLDQKNINIKENFNFDKIKLIEQIKNYFNEMKFSNLNSKYSLKMILRPDELGKINLDITMKNNQLNAKLKVDNIAAFEALNSSLEQLKEILYKKGFEKVNIEINVISNEYKDYKDYSENEHQQKHKKKKLQLISDDELESNSISI